MPGLAAVQACADLSRTHPRSGAPSCADLGVSKNYGYLLLLFRVLHQGPLFSETPRLNWFAGWALAGRVVPVWRET